MIRDATRRRVRALQMLYACDVRPEQGGDESFRGLARIIGPRPRILDGAKDLVDGVLNQRDELDGMAQAAADNWRFDRIAAIERNILRLAIHELSVGVTPPRVAIDEAIWLTHRFAGPRAAAFVNGVLDRVARDLGVL